MTSVLLTPVDTFFFRDHKELTPGENSSASGIFPPRPGTVYGAFRSAYIHKFSDFSSFSEGKEGEVKKWMGTPQVEGEFSIQGVFLHDGKEIVLPLPIDHQVISKKDDVSNKEKRVAYPLILKKETAFTSDSGVYRLHGISDEKSSSSDGLLVGLELWKQELLNRSGQVNTFGLEDLLIKEPKLGIYRNWQTNCSEDGMLYQMTMASFRVKHKGTTPGLAILFESSPDLSNLSLLKIGGENKPWTVSAANLPTRLFSNKEKKKISKQIKQTQVARIILLTPAIWNYGNRPGCWDQESNELQLANDVTVELLTVAVSRPQIIGGWDIDKEKPKKRMYAVSAGTVLYVKVPIDQAESFVNTVFSTNFSDELAYEGYGFAVCGSYQLQEESE